MPSIRACASTARCPAAMAEARPSGRKLLEVEGHRLWLPGRDEGYAQLVAALDDQRGW